MDIANATADAMLCPLDGRRDWKAPISSLLIVHLTTISAYCHILSVRKEPILTWRTLYFFLVPLSIPAYHALAFAAITLAYVYWHFRPSEELKDAILRAPRWLLGAAPKSVRLETATTRYGDGEAGLGTEEGDEDDSKTPWWMRFGRFILALTFLVQCIGTITLYVRRLRHNAVTRADQRTFELACAGIITAIYWLGNLLRLPIFTQDAPNVQSIRMTLLDNILVALRDSQAETLSYDNNDFSDCSLVRSGAISLLILGIQDKYRLKSLIKAYWRYWAVDWDRLSDEMLLEFMTGLIAFELSPAVAGIVCFTDDYKMFKITRAHPWYWMPLLVPLLWVPMLFLLGFGTVFVVSAVDAGALFRQVYVLAHWSRESSCPLLWSDPDSSWLWSLA